MTQVKAHLDRSRLAAPAKEIRAVRFVVVPGERLAEPVHSSDASNAKLISRGGRLAEYSTGNLGVNALEADVVLGDSALLELGNELADLLGLAQGCTPCHERAASDSD